MVNPSNSSFFVGLTDLNLTAEQKIKMREHKTWGKCKNEAERVTYVFHSLRTKEYQTENTGINLRRRVTRTISYLWNTVVLTVFRKEISKKLEPLIKDLNNCDQTVAALVVEPKPQVERPVVEPEPQDFALNKVDQAKWLSVKKFLCTKKITEESPLLVKISDGNCRVWGDDRRIFIEKNDNSLTIVWKQHPEPIVVVPNVDGVIKPGSKEYLEILNKTFERTPEGVIESDAIPVHKKPFANEATDDQKLEFLLNYLSDGHKEDAARIMFRDSKDNFRSVRTKDQEVLFCRVNGEGSQEKGILAKYCKKDGVWKRSPDLDLKEDDKKNIQEMVLACNAYTLARASKIADATSSQLVLDKEKLSCIQNILNKNNVLRIQRLHKLPTRKHMKIIQFGDLRLKLTGLIEYLFLFNQLNYLIPSSGSTCLICTSVRTINSTIGWMEEKFGQLRQVLMSNYRKKSGC